MNVNRLLALVVLIVCGYTASANHVLGGNITWNCLGGDQYQVTFTLYKDCYGNAGDPATETVFFYPTGCAAVPFSADFNFVSAVQISDLCATELVNSSCSGGLNPGTVAVTYTGTVTLDAGCTWEAIWNNGDWNYFQNMDNFDGLGFPLDAYIHSVINTNLPCQNSTDITYTAADPQIPYFCFGTNTCHQLQVSNPNGYTLTYSLGACQTTGATIDNPINAPGYTTPTGLTITPGGLICWPVPGPSFGTYSVCVEIEMYDGLDYVGTMYESMAVVVRNCAPTTTVFDIPNVTSVGSDTNLINGTTVEVCAGDSLIFTVEASNSDILRSIDLDFTGGPAGLVMAQAGLNPAVGTFSLLATGAMVNASPYTVQVTATDDACPNPDTDVINITVHIRPNVELTFNDTTICEGTNVTLQAFGLPNAANYDWTNVSGDNTPPVIDGQATQSVTPDQTSVYSVTAPGIPASCQSSDQVTVNVVLSDITEVVTNESCGSNNGAINITIVGPGSGNYDIQWNGDGSVDQVQDQTNLLGGNYDVTIEDLVYGCSITDNFVVADNPLPTATLTPATSIICAGESVNLTLDFTPNGGTFDFLISPYPAGLDTTAVSDPYTFSVSPASSTIYNVTLISDNTNCNAAVNLTSNITVRPVVTGDFIQEAAVCGGTNVSIEIDYDNPFVGPYIVGYSINGGATQVSGPVNDLGAVFTNTPTGPTTIYDIEYIQYTNAPFCPSTDALNPPMTIDVFPLPTATIAGATTVCEDAVLNLPLTFTGTGPWTVNYTINGTAQAALAGLVAGATISVNTTTPGTFNYCITSVSDANCTNSNNSLLNSCAQVIVAAYPTVVFGISDTQLCPGDCANVEVDVTCPGSTTFCVSFADTPEGSTVPDTDICSQPIGVQFNYQICPLVDTDYSIGAVYCNNAPACATDLNQTISVLVNEDITVVATDTICNNTSTQYQVVYTMSNGTQPYDVQPGAGIGVGSPPNPINQTTYTTAFVNSGTNGSWTFSDGNDCNLVVMSVTGYSCPIVTQPCDMSNTALELCGVSQATGTCVIPSVLDGNDDEMWVLCTDATNLTTIFATDVATNNNAPQFTFIPGTMQYGVSYCMVSIAGNADGLGGVNPATPLPFIEFSDCQSVTWYETPTASLTALLNDSTACLGQSVSLSIDFQGTGPWTFSYSINNGVPLAPITTSNDPYTLVVNTAGLYTLETVSSGPNGLCQGTVSGDINVVINPLPTATWSAADETCEGIDHCFTINFTAGATPWDLTIDNPAPDADTPLNNVTQNYQYCVGTAGSYDILSITDNNGCVSTANFAPVVLTVNELPEVAWTEDDELFCQGSNVVIELDFTAGESPYSVNITSPDPDVVNPQLGVTDGQTFTVNVEGNYVVNSVIDNNGCVSATGDAVFVDQINTPVANAGTNQEQCVGEDVTVGITPPVAGVTYEWAGAPADDIVGSNTTSEVIVNAATAGTSTYTVTVTTDIGNCTATDDVDVTYYNYPVIDITSDTDSLCANGCANLTASGADAFLWENFNGAVGPFNLAALQVCPDTTDFFIVTGTDNYVGASCSTTDSIEIFIGDAISVVEDFTAEVCFGTCDGEIELEVSGGVEPFTVTGDITELFTDSLCPGTYNYTITDAIGCQLLGGSIVIDERAPEFIDQIIITNPECDYDVGSIEVIDNTTSINVTAILCGYNVSQDGPQAIFENLQACEYIITTIFDFGDIVCSTDSIVEIEIQSPDINFNPLWTEDTFCYNENACFEGVPAGGTGALDVQWFFDEELTQFANTDNPYCVPTTEDLTLYGVAIDQVGCYSDTVEVISHIFPEITLELESGADTTFVCEYSCAELNAVVGGGNGNVTVEWYELPFDNVTSTELNYEVCPIFDTQYVVIASDGCSQPLTDTVTVHVWDTPEIIFSVDTLEGCFPLTVTFIDMTLPIADNVTCEWGFGEGTTLGVCDTVQFTYNLPQLYAEYYSSLTITTENGCVGTDTLVDPIVVHGYPEVDFSWEPQPVTVLEHEVQFINLTEGAGEYLWNFYRMETTPLENPIHDFPLVDLGVFPICLTAISEFGCADTLCQDIIMESLLQVFVPNTFTPDDDGINDFWLPVVTGEVPGSYKCWVFNRWGDPMFYTQDSRMAWTGESDNGQYYVTNDTFVWRIEVQALQDGRIEVFEGHVTMAR